ncbi:hypothetical protein IWW38_001250 [Coemansia aciculifera]|uniref:Uncharacterized protein n=1 Tax=Coemansia aciculifera TaxID=417176 RepID=A0ACC1M7C7_9FUNG|nr:hypothetical protein IWW38_001250 [Coemansia aciculifera]
MSASKSAAAAKRKLSVWEKAFMRDEDWRKDELREVVFWLIAGFSLVLGLFFGLAGFRGLPCFVSYFIGVAALPSVYWTSFLGVDDADFGGKMEVVGDSLGTGAAMFVLAWVGTFTTFHS